MATIQITIDDTVNTDALTFIRNSLKDEQMTLENFLTGKVKQFAKKQRVLNLDIEALISQTGL
jgi:hypothetical protein